MRLRGQVAVVTGAGRGIGQAIALAFAREGARVGVADIDPRTARATAQRIGAARALALTMDVADAASVEAGLAAVEARWRRLDIAVTNAAIEPRAPFLELSEETWDRVIDVNLKGTFLVGAGRRPPHGPAAAWRHHHAVVGERGGRAAGVGGLRGQRGGVRQLTRAMAVALAPYGIRVNAIGPGTVVTGLTRHLLRDRRWREVVYMRTPMQRVARPSEMAEIAVFLASEASSSMTGTTVYADGGRLALNDIMPLPGRRRPAR